MYGRRKGSCIVFFHSFELLHAYCDSNAVLGTGDVSVDKTDKNPCPCEAYILGKD